MSGNARAALPPALLGVSLGKIRKQHPAFIRGVTAGFGTTPAVLHLVLRTFLGTGIANLGADLPYHVNHFAVTRHIGRGKPANLRTVRVKAHATRHFRRIRFSETGYRAAIAGIGTFITGFDAGSVLLIDHVDTKNL